MNWAIVPAKVVTARPCFSLPRICSQPSGSEFLRDKTAWPFNFCDAPPSTPVPLIETACLFVYYNKSDKNLQLKH